MANIIRVPVDNPEELRNSSAYGSGAIIRLESATTQAGAYNSVATVALADTQRSYTLYDQAGGLGTWYRTRYENAGGSVLSAYSSPFQVGSSGLTDLAAVKARLGADPADTKNDETLLDFISDVSDWIEGTTGRSFRPDPTTVYLFDGYSALERGRMLPIPRGIQSVSLVEVAYYTGGPFQTIPLSDIFLRPVQRDPGWPYTELWISDVPSNSNTVPLFPAGMGNIRPTGVYGWDHVPGDIHDVALNLVISSFRARSAGGAEQVRVGLQGERTYDRMLSFKDSRTIARYTFKSVELV